MTIRFYYTQRVFFARKKPSLWKLSLSIQSLLLRCNKLVFKRFSEHNEYFQILAGRHCVNHIPFQQQWKWWIRTFLITMTFPKALTLERIARPVPQRQKSKNTQSNDLAHRTFMKSNSKDFWQSRRQLSPQLTLNQMKVINHIALSKHLSIRVECWKTFALRRFVTIRLASN